MRKLRLLTLITLLAAVVIGTAAYAKKKQDNAVFAPKAHHVIYASWRVDKDGVKTLEGVRVRDVEESGAWKEWSANYRMDHTTLADYSAPGKFAEAAKSHKSVAFFRSLPHFLREETILGYQCFTLDMNGAEMTYSPEFGATPLKFVSKGGTVIEALKIY